MSAESVCPKRHLHAPAPDGYIARQEWFSKMALTHRQLRCPGCGLWKVWEQVAISAAQVLTELSAQLTPGKLLAGLTLWQPWAWAILEAGKPVENRTWELPSWIRGKWVALHAGVGSTKRNRAEDLEWIRDVFNVEVPPPETLVMRAVVGLVKFGGARRVRGELGSWEQGPWAWDVVGKFRLPSPLTMNGAQGFWKVAPDVTQQVLAQVETLGRAA